MGFGGNQQQQAWGLYTEQYIARDKDFAQVLDKEGKNDDPY